MKDSDSKAKTLTPEARKVWAGSLGQRVLGNWLNNQQASETDRKLLREQLKQTETPKK